jgi:hypothetical protein
MFVEKWSIFLKTSPKQLVEGVEAGEAATKSPLGNVVERSLVSAAAGVVKVVLLL